MDTIGKEDLWTFTDSGSVAEVSNCLAVRTSKGHKVSDFFELAAKIAELQFRNRGHVLFYRGQQRDHIIDNQKPICSSLRPTIFRRPKNLQDSGWLSPRFNALRDTEQQLIRIFRDKDFLGAEEIGKYRILRWAILQHYEICATPLLDVTQSLRIGASFASVENNTNNAYLFVLGVPNVSGAITASAEAGLQTIRLSSVCPPTAMRPHIQEGFLLGEYPEIGDIDQRGNYSLDEVDFGHRLVAKFRFDPTKFWTKRGQFQEVGRKALYPSPSEDALLEALKSISSSS